MLVHGLSHGSLWGTSGAAVGLPWGSPWRARMGHFHGVLEGPHRTLWDSHEVHVRLPLGSWGDHGVPVGHLLGSCGATMELARVCRS